MDLETIKQATFQCAECKTGIVFNIPQPTASEEEKDKLSETIKNLKCPCCNVDMGTGASKMLEFIQRYNHSVHTLNFGISMGNIELKMQWPEKHSRHSFDLEF